MGIKVISVLAGAIVGTLIGMTGMGGGAMMTPFLILVMKMNPVNAVGTDLAFAAVTKLGGGIQHFRQKTVQLDRVFWMGLGSLPASLLGARFVLSNLENDHLTRFLLPTLLGIVLVTVGFIVLFRTTTLASVLISDDASWPPPLFLILVGALGGLLVGVTSVGGGTVIVALLLMFFSMPTDQLVGVDVAHGATLALFSATFYAMAGQTDWSILGWLLLGSIPGSWLGARAVTWLPQKWVRAILGAVLLLVGARLVW